MRHGARAVRLAAAALAGLAAGAALACGCAHSPARGREERVFAVLSREPGKRVVRYGKVTLVERWGESYIPHTLIVVGDEDRKLEVRSLLTAAFPLEMGPLADSEENYDGTLNLSVGSKALDISIRTIDEYAGVLADGARKASRQPPDAQALRREFQGHLGNGVAVVYRYVSTRDDGRPLPPVLAPVRPPPAAVAPLKPGPAPAGVRPPEERRREAERLWRAGLVEFSKAEYKRAREQWTACRELDPANADCASGLERIEAEDGALKGGAGLPPLSAEESRAAADTHWRRGLDAFARGDQEAAAAEWRLCRLLDPANTDCPAGLERVQAKPGPGQEGRPER